MNSLGYFFIGIFFTVSFFIIERILKDYIHHERRLLINDVCDKFESILEDQSKKFGSYSLKEILYQIHKNNAERLESEKRLNVK